MNCIIRAYVLLFVLGCGPLARSQDVHTQVVNARNGKPITDECLNISLGKWRGAELLAPTNREGIVGLHIKNRQVTADTTSPHACNGQAVLGPKFLTNDVESISVIGDVYVVCQEYGNHLSGQPPPLHIPSDVVPTYRISKIVELGEAAANTCGKFKAQAKPGELILFVRPMSFWEKLKL
jgi:hypothetical protein